MALTTTLNASFGSCVTAVTGGRAFLLNNEMDDFSGKPGTPNTFGLVQGKANAIAPGKRMLSSMSPTIVLDDKGAVFAVAGSGGGPRIITAVWQTLSNVIDFHFDGDVAVAAPRISPPAPPRQRPGRGQTRSIGATADRLRDDELRAPVRRDVARVRRGDRDRTRRARLARHGRPARR